jgi:predicted Zn-dependent peptidase
MLQFHKFTLANGLRFIVNEDESTPMAAINVLYNVGSRDENPERTGMAHLFEHLMFSGSKHIKDFDTIVQNAGGESNAFTNPDQTNFHETFPAQNIEIGFWLESDRMFWLNVKKSDLETQRKVVLEEFKETTLNEPYGDVMHHLSEMAYLNHPYRWPVIGLVPEHVEKATLKEAQTFYRQNYNPSNAIIAVCGNVKLQQIKDLAEKWFSDIPAVSIEEKNYPKESAFTYLQSKTVESNVPVPAIFMTFRTCDRFHEDFYTTDFISDVLGSGRSSRFYANLLKEQRLFSSIDASISGSMDEGLFIIEGKLQEDISFEAAEKAIWEELTRLKNEPLSEYELQKIKNKMESSMLFSESSTLDIAISFAYYESLGDADLFNTEIDRLQAITAEDIQRVSNQLFLEEKVMVLRYKPNSVAAAV